ncbi:DUF2059 domain-containing protein [Rhodobacteraceae bacterium F11138]|nr:DUF2059 domain-containing protein [Rhodobacteraceae bacterium F11138]
MNIACKFSRSARIFPGLLSGILLMALMLSAPAFGATDRDRIRAFLDVTGFDVALDSIALSAGDAPQVLGLQAEAFGSQWQRLSGEVFDTGVMRDLALDILQQTLTDELLNHAAGFYATDLGQRLVIVENQSHLEEDENAKLEQGQQIIADLVAQGAPRLELLTRMNRAIDASETGLRAVQQIQMRFLLAASAAGVIDLQMDAEELAALLSTQEAELRRALQISALAGAAYTYRSFSDDDLTRYVEALEHPQMRQVYELLNAVQHEITANRFEVLAHRMAEIAPSQEL